MFIINPQTPNHTKAIETLLDKAFGSTRTSKRSYHFRRGVKDIPALRFVALAGNKLVGTIRFWPIAIDDPETGQSIEALILGPLGVSPNLQGRGIGAALIEHGIEVAREQGHKIVILVGDLTYYGRFGFSPAAAHQHHITMPGEQDHRVLVRELSDDALIDVRGAITSKAATK
jgi:predicted N-acetyltransferase YhbS